MHKKTILFIFIVLILGGTTVGWFYSRTLPVSTETEVEDASGPKMLTTYFCMEGTIVAEFSGNTVKLGLSDGRSISLVRATSSTGLVYKKGISTFITEGSDAYYTESDMTIYSDCVAGTQASVLGINTFENAAKYFRFKYETGFTLAGGGIGYSPSWTANSSKDGKILAKVYIPKSYQPGTNFSEAFFTVGSSKDTEAVASCTTGFNNVPGVPSSLNNFPFVKVKFADAGAGNFYETTSYRIVRNDKCYAVEYTIHSTNIGNYPPEMNIVEFDKVRVEEALEKMAQSFMFI